MLPANTCPSLSPALSSPTLNNILSTLAPLLPPLPNTPQVGQTHRVEEQDNRTASSSVAHGGLGSSLQQTQGLVATDNKDTLTSSVVAEVQSSGTSQSSQTTSSTISSSSLPIMVPVIMNPSKPVSSLPQPEQNPLPLQPTLEQQDILSNLQNAKLLQSLLQVASTLPTQPLLPVGPVGQGLTAPLNLQSLLQGVPPASSGFLPVAQPVGQVDTTQLAQSAKSTLHPGSQSSVASSSTLPLQQTQSANLSSAVGEGKKTTLPLTCTMSVGSLKSGTPRGPRRTPLAQVNTNVTPVQHTFSMLKPALRTEGYLAGVTGYHDNSTPISTAYPVLLAEQWEVGGDKPPPLGDGGTLEQRDTQTAKETI